MYIQYKNYMVVWYPHKNVKYNDKQNVYKDVITERIRSKICVDTILESNMKEQDRRINGLGVLRNE